MNEPREDIADGWKEASLGSICRFVMGQSPPSETYNDIGQGMPFLQGKAEFGEIHPVPSVFCTAPLKVAPADSVLISVRAPVGDVNVADREFIIGRGLAAVQFLEGDNGFLFFLLQENSKKLRALGSGTTFQSINKATLEQFRVRVPPLHQQKSIAHVLETVQKAKEARQRELALERERKAALMEHLFTYGTRGEATQQTEIGEIPESWQLVNIDAVAKVGNGSTPSRADERYWKDGTIPWITSTKVHEVVIEQSNEFITDTARNECHLPLVPKGSLVVAITGQGKTLGNTAILEFDTCINQHLAYIQITDEALQPYFALHYLSSKYEYFRGVSSGGGSTKGALTCGFLKRMKIPVPPEDEQKCIAQLLSACEMKCGSLEKEIVLLDELFAAALDELMNGRLNATALVDGGSNE